MRSLLVVALLSEVAWAGLPAWCEDARAEARLSDLSSIEPGSGFSSHAEIFFIVHPKPQISPPP